MKTKLRQTIPRRSPRQLFRKRARRHDPMLLLNMSLFNFTDGWGRVFSKEQYASPCDNSTQTTGSVADRDERSATIRRSQSADFRQAHSEFERDQFDEVIRRMQLMF